MTIFRKSALKSSKHKQNKSIHKEMFLKMVLFEEAHLLVKLLTKTLHLGLPILKELSWLQNVICSLEERVTKYPFFH